MKEIKFDKYEKYGAYHWNLLSINIFKRNCLIETRYNYCINLLCNELKKHKDNVVLDFGCGDGALSYLLYKKGFKVHGGDTSKVAIDIAIKQHNKYKTNVSFSVVSDYSTPFSNSYFDSVVMCDVLEHVRYPEKLLNEIKRIVKPNGVVIISTPIKLKKLPLDIYHVHEWFTEDFISIVSKNFSIVNHTVSHPVVWSELYHHSCFCRFFLQVFSRIKNPFLNNCKWGIYRQQYIVAKI